VCCLPALVCVAAPVAIGSAAAEPLVLQDPCIRLEFDRSTGSLTAIHNRLTGESYGVQGDLFSIELGSETVEQTRARLLSIAPGRDRIAAEYQAEGLRVRVTYALAAKSSFLEKRLELTFGRGDALKSVTISRPAFSAPELEIVCYRYPQFGRAPGTEPSRTFFGRTPQGGLFTGVAMPFDHSTCTVRTVELGYSPSVKVAAGQTIACETMYLGVYARCAEDAQPLPPPIRHSPHDASAPPELQQAEGEVVPLASEAAAMVAMASEWLGPPRHGLVPMACGWHSEMQQRTYPSDDDVAADMRSLDFLAECGVDWVSDSHPWGGETEMMNGLGPDDHYEPGPRARRFLEHARKVGVRVVMWPTMGNTHPWSPLGKPFRADRPEWLIAPGPASRSVGIIAGAKGDCFANRPFYEWLQRINREGLATGLYPGWAMDGSFFGDGGWYTTIVPVDCTSDAHDHLPGDANWASQNALDRLIADVRAQRPDTFIFTCRPSMDLGVFSLRNVDTCFTLLETGTGTSNLDAGDEIRRWSRYRVHHHFFPHYLDQPLLFPSRADRNAPPNWPSENLDYILLSGLSSSPNLLLYLPTKTGIPEQDKATIRRWLDWGRANEEYLKVRRDLPDWPGSGRVDGSAHVVGDRGLVFLFNSSSEDRVGEFTLTVDGIGWRRRGACRVTQEYPAAGPAQVARHGQTIQWPVPPETAVVLRISPGG